MQIQAKLTPLGILLQENVVKTQSIYWDKNLIKQKIRDINEKIGLQLGLELKRLRNIGVFNIADQINHEF